MNAASSLRCGAKHRAAKAKQAARRGLQQSLLLTRRLTGTESPLGAAFNEQLTSRLNFYTGLENNDFGVVAIDTGFI